jgi:hypothetical protein
MSYHWENIVWQSQDGSWNHGYYTRISGAGGGYYSDPDYGYDSERDDDFDYTSFAAVKSGFASSDDAWDFMPFGNPGSGSELSYAGHSKECKALDQLAHWHRHPEEKAKAERKEHLRRVREHFKKLDEEWPSEAMAALSYGTFQVEFKRDAQVYTRLGISTSSAGALTHAGDWLLVAGAKVYNLKTQKFEKSVHSFKRVMRSGF